MIDADKKSDAEISPMEAQNEGPAHRGPAKEPLPKTAGKPEETAPPSPVRAGGEGESRDDL